MNRLLLPWESISPEFSIDQKIMIRFIQSLIKRKFDEAFFIKRGADMKYAIELQYV